MTDMRRMKKVSLMNPNRDSMYSQGDTMSAIYHHPDGNTVIIEPNPVRRFYFLWKVYKMPALCQ